MASMSVLSQSNYNIASQQLRVSRFSGTCVGAALSIAANGAALWCLGTGQRGWKKTFAISVLSNTLPRIIEHAFIWQMQPKMDQILYGKDVRPWRLPAAARGAISGAGHWWEGGIKGALIYLCAHIGSEEEAAPESFILLQVVVSTACRIFRSYQGMSELYQESQVDYSDQELNAFQAGVVGRYATASWTVKPGNLDSLADVRGMRVVTGAFGALPQNAKTFEFFDWFVTPMAVLAMRTSE